MTDKERMVWDEIRKFHHDMELLDQGYVEALCRFEYKKSIEEIEAEADLWYEHRKEHMVKKLISALEPIMKGE